MTFKDNLLRKIEIDALVRKVQGSFGPSGSGKRLDKTAMRRLLVIGNWPLTKERDLELYLLEEGTQHSKILVFDNDLPIYNSTIDDVVMRKSPTLKEMISIRNAIKILSDNDVIISKKGDSLKKLHRLLIDQLDISFTPSDIDQLSLEGRAALENANSDEMRESLNLFAELLRYRRVPKALQRQQQFIIGQSTKKETGKKILWGPVIVYNPSGNTLALYRTSIDGDNRDHIERYQNIFDGAVDADLKGAAVFSFLKSEVSQAPSKQSA